MADQPKLESGEKFVSEKISVSDHVNGFHYTADNSADNFVIDMESFSNGVDNSRIKLQRNLSRKNSQRGSENKIANENTNSSPAGPSPRGSSSTPEKQPTATSSGTVGTTTTADHGQVHHQITITTAGNDGRSVLRRNSVNKRYSRWVIDPRKIVFAFATLSSMGTILLIYLTLSLTKYSAEENGIDWQQP